MLEFLTFLTINNDATDRKSTINIIFKWKLLILRWLNQNTLKSTFKNNKNK